MPVGVLKLDLEDRIVLGSFLLYNWGFQIKEGRAEFHAFPFYRFAENTQFSPSLLDSTRGQWPYRPASNKRAMINRPMILYDINFLGILIKESKGILA